MGFGVFGVLGLGTKTEKNIEEDQREDEARRKKKRMEKNKKKVIALLAHPGELPAFSHVETSHGPRRHEDASRPPAHQECANGKPWMWAIMCQECMTRKMRAEFENFAAQHTQDGPLVKWIMQWKQQQYQQSERPPVSEEDEIMPMRESEVRSVDEAVSRLEAGSPQEWPPVGARGHVAGTSGCLDNRKQ